MPEGSYCVIDDVSYTINKKTQFVSIFGNSINPFASVSDTSYVVTMPDRKADYFYKVQSHLRFLESDGQIQAVIGLPSPKVLPATNLVSGKAFTANWTPVSKADRYILNCYGVVSASESAGKEVTFLSEDFSTIDSSVVSVTDPANPKRLYNTSSSLDDYTKIPGWTGDNNSIAQGYLGVGQAVDYVGSYILTPALKLDHDTKCTMRVKAVGATGDDLYITYNNDESWLELPYDANGKLDTTVVLSDITDGVQFKFASWNGDAFMLDEIKISQTLADGQDALVLVDSEPVVNTTSALVTGLDSFGFSTYGYTVTAQKDYVPSIGTISSVPSEMQTVKFASIPMSVTGLQSVNKSKSVSESYYDMNGRKLYRPQRGFNIIRYNDGTSVKVIRK